MMGRMTDLAGKESLGPEPPEGHLAALNEAQCRAVAAVEGAVLVLAGGRTRQTPGLTTRPVHILGTGGAYPREGLAGTLTNQARGPVKERLHHMNRCARDR